MPAIAELLIMRVNDNSSDECWSYQMNLVRIPTQLLRIKVAAYCSRSLIGNDDLFFVSCQKRIADRMWLNCQTEDVETVDGIIK